MKLKVWLICNSLLVLLPCVIFAQTRKPLTNDDIVSMTKQGFEAPLIVKAIQAADNNFDVSAQALVDLKNAGVSQQVMEAMLSPRGNESSGPTEGVHGAEAVPSATVADISKHPCSPREGCLLREGDEVSLKFANAVSSKTAEEGESVEFVLDSDLKVGDTIVVRKDSHALATVSHVKKAGMMGKGGELNVQMQYLVTGDNRVRLRGTKTVKEKTKREQQSFLPCYSALSD